MAKLLTGVVAVLVVSHTPRTLVNIFESYQVVPWTRGVYTILLRGGG